MQFIRGKPKTMRKSSLAIVLISLLISGCKVCRPTAGCRWNGFGDFGCAWVGCTRCNYCPSGGREGGLGCCGEHGANRPCCGLWGLFGYCSRTRFCGPNCYSQGLDNAEVCQTAKFRARKGIRQFCAQSDYRPTCHFSDGFEQAYIDIAQGGSGVTPAVPPERYWSAPYRTAEGHAAASDWFDGYATGAAIAGQNAAYNVVPASTSLSGQAAGLNGPNGVNGGPSGVISAAEPGY